MDFLKVKTMQFPRDVIAGHGVLPVLPELISRDLKYKDNPIQVETGENVRAFILNEGPNIDTSFHIVGTIFHRVVKEGIALEAGNEGNWGSQAVDLAPAQGAIVEFTFDEDGLYPIVTHAFNFVAHGALGLFQAGDGGAAAPGGH